MDNFKRTIVEAAKKRILYTSHALHQMNKPDRMISKDEVRGVIEQGEIIEDYPEDPRGHSCLMVGDPSVKRIIHIACSPKPDYLAIITSYIPTEDEWEEGFKQRKKR
ncbi:MAG: DUF4258 domain-containing protein [Candidatus Omnitrophica bacterium]|nr:DUF4258 domain-containing protein [Candidatus Omnitrophota bacterium]